MAPNDRIYQTELGDKEDRLAVGKGKGSGEGWSGRSGSADASVFIQNG